MKRFLPLMAMTAIASTAMAVSNQELADLYVTAVSATGRYLVGEDQGIVIIRDLEQNRQTVFSPVDETDLSNYGAGVGNCVSSDGVVVGSNRDHAGYFSDGEFISLQVKFPEYTSLANGITPDGSVICGQQGLAAISADEDNLMCAPCVWYRNDDGSYGDAVALPHPELDFAGRVPQYITAVAVSSDGRTIAGQIRDCVGFVMQPILYTRDDKGEWSYRLVGADLINPDKLEFPEFPGNGPVYPSLESFMTAEEIAAYTKAVEDWTNECTETGNWDYATYPLQEDFATEAEKEAYNKAMEDFTTEQAKWQAEYTRYMGIYEQVSASSPSFIFNSVFLSTDGTRYGSTCAGQQGDNGGIAVMKNAPRRAAAFETPETTTPLVFNLEDGDSYLLLVSDKGVDMTGIADDHTVVGTYDSSTLPKAYVFPADKTEGVFLEEWMQSANSKTAEWMEDNMVFDVRAYDMETFQEIVIPDVMCSGSPRVSGDMSVVTCSAYNTWSDEPVYYYTFVLDGLGDSGVRAAGAGETGMELSAAGGVVTVAGAVEASAYTLDGVCVYAGDPSGFSLAKGVYIVKAIASDGSIAAFKVNI